MVRSVSALTLPPILQPAQYTILGRNDRGEWNSEIPCNEKILQFLRICQQSEPYTKRDPTSLEPQNLSSVGEGRIFWNAMADLINSSSFFPITINVPDMLSAMGSFISQLPIINRIYLYLTQESTPRKKKKKKPPVPVSGHTQDHPVNTVQSSGYPVKKKRIKKRRKIF